MFNLIILGILVIVTVISLIVVFASRNKAGAILWTAFIALVTGVTWLFMSYTQVPTGYGGVVQTFGKVELKEAALGEGLRWIKPWQSVTHMSNQQLTFDRNDDQGNAATVQAKDKIRMEADVSFHSILNHSAMPWIRKNFGENYHITLLKTSQASAVRNAAAQFENWEELQVDKRVDFQAKITSEYEKTVKEKLETKGLPVEIVNGAFNFPQVDLRKIVPVDIELTREIALTNAELKKSDRKLTEITNAALDARKRGQDGVAIRDTIMRVLHPADLEGNLSEDAAMPEGVSLAEISAFINAIAEIKRADAVELAAQNGDLTVMVVGGGNTNAALPLPKQ